MVRAFVIANGPSLLKMDLSKLENEITFGCNTIFDFKEIKFAVDYYFYLNPLISIILRYKIIRYLDNEKVKKGYIQPFLRQYIQHPKIEGYDHPLHSVGIWMIYKALELGYDPVYVIGMDINYKFPPLSKLNQHFTIDSLPVDNKTKEILLELGNKISMKNVFTFKDEDDDDLSHASNYFAKNKIPEHYATSAAILSSICGRFFNIPNEDKLKVFNAGIGGNVEFLKRVDFKSLFQK